MTRRTRSLVLLALFSATPAALLAQANAARTPRRASATAVSRALETITDTDYGAELNALAHDSTRGRETPSPELDKAAVWVAARFRAAGLRPAGGDYLQPFGLRRSRLDTLTTFTISGSGAAAGLAARWVLGRQVGMLGGGLPAEARDLRVFLMVGAPADSARPFGEADVRDAAIVLVHPLDQAVNAVINSVYAHASTAGARIVLFVGPYAAERWAQRLARSAPERWVLAEHAAAGDGRLALLAAPLATAAELLRAAGEDTASVLTPARRGFRPLGGVAMSVAPHETTIEEPTVANVVGVLEGSDPTLRNEAVVFTAHYDHVGVVGGRCQLSRTLPADSICNGADDNASGTVGIIEMARAFAALRPRPSRTLVFAALAAEERGLLGAYAYLAQPVIPVERTVANVNLDMIARNGRDTVGFVGKDFTSLGAVVDGVLREHPELRLASAEHAGLYPNSDHYAFAQRGVPALFFFSGVYDDLHTAADNVDRAGIEQAARIARLAFLVGLEVANAADRPVWDPAARARAVHP